MKPYLFTTGLLFALVTLVHAWRAVVEGLGPFRDPWFMVITIISACLSVWAWRLFLASARK